MAFCPGRFCPAGILSVGSCIWLSFLSWFLFYHHHVQFAWVWFHHRAHFSLCVAHYKVWAIQMSSVIWVKCYRRQDNNKLCFVTQMCDLCLFWEEYIFAVYLSSLFFFLHIYMHVHSEHIVRCNSVPINLRQCRSLEQIKRLLKTFLFCAWGHGALWYFT